MLQGPIQMYIHLIQHVAFDFFRYSTGNVEQGEDRSSLISYQTFKGQGIDMCEGGVML